MSQQARRKVEPEVVPAAFTVTGAADYTGLSPSFIWRQTYAGKLKSISLGRKCRRWRRIDLDEYLAAHADDSVAA